MEDFRNKNRLLVVYFRREKFILLQVCLTGGHLVFTFLGGKSSELAALMTLLARLPVNYRQLS